MTLKWISHRPWYTNSPATSISKTPASSISIFLLSLFSSYPR